MNVSTGIREMTSPATTTVAPALSIRGLRVSVGATEVVRGVTLDLPPGQTLALVGESGAGKSMTAKATMGLLPKGGRVTAGSVEINGRRVIDATVDDTAAIRGNDVAMVFQNPLRSLNPTTRVGAQITEAIRVHEKVSRADAKKRAIELLDRVRIPAARQRFSEYPHQLSGGMRQRVVIAMALACSPSVLIADEPTTALDVTTQAQILDLLSDLQRTTGMSIVLVTHDIRIAQEVSHFTGVMYAGQIVELGPTNEIAASPRMPYTRALLDTVPAADQPRHSPLPVISGRPPDLSLPITGCAFQPRCANATAACAVTAPPLSQEGDHSWTCWNSPEGARA